MTANQPPYRVVALLVGLCLLFAGSQALAQPSGPFGPDGPGGEPGGPGGNGPPPWAGGPPPWAGGDDDDDDEEEEENEEEGVPDFCSGGPQPGGPNGQAGMSSIAHLNFSPIDPETGEPIEEEEGEELAKGRIMYRWMAPLFDYVFNAHELPPEAEYTLTYQPEPFPSTGVICLGTSTVNEDGDLHLQDAFDIDTDLPADYDENEEEATLALVVTADVDCEAGEMVNWVPEDYLFGVEGMFYVDSDLEEDEEEEEEEEEEGDDP